MLINFECVLTVQQIVFRNVPIIVLTNAFFLNCLKKIYVFRFYHLRHWKRCSLFVGATDYGHTKAEFFGAEIQIPNKYLGYGYKGLVFVKNMDTVPKWVLIVRPKYPQCHRIYLPNMSAKVLDFNEKRLLWASVVRGSSCIQEYILIQLIMTLDLLESSLKKNPVKFSRKFTVRYATKVR
jgi:hypothetical protein